MQSKYCKQRIVDGRHLCSPMVAEVEVISKIIFDEITVSLGVDAHEVPTTARSIT